MRQYPGILHPRGKLVQATNQTDKNLFLLDKNLPDIILNLDKVTLATGGNVRKFEIENLEKNI